MQKDELAQLDLPDAPGVYKFRDSKRRILYIGKATSLRDRVKSYFASDLVRGRGTRITHMVAEAASVDWEEAESVLEALILEANLIKKHQPPYNVREKDNKSFNYLVITREEFPQVLVVRGRDLFQSWQDADIKYLFGPFPEGGTLKVALRLVRKIFPFRDFCVPESGKPCFNCQIGLCPGVCSGEISKKNYAQVIRNIVLLFSGKKHALLGKLERDMKRFAREEQFERAAQTKRQIEALTHIRDIALIKNGERHSGGGAIRIEGFDIAHTSGTETVGVMVVVSGGEVARSEIRRFKVREAKNNDIAALTEVLERRLVHTEWPLPRLIVIDGGQGQVNAAERVLKDAGVAIPIVGVVKDERHRPKRIIGNKERIREYEREILLANNEAHRRAVAYHRKRRSGLRSSKRPKRD